MRLNRTFTVVVVALALLAVTLPAAQARSFEPPQPAVHSPGGSWMAAAVTWLARLVGAAPPPVSSRSAATTTTTTNNYVMIPMTGVCIDPNGNQVPCRGGF
ncbi:MAG TPA: hypothetical protein VFC23_19760 [Thermoanaerobaculia bacterium]|nr:hypothetical protein [Thermoanaerobaculia bacterium]